MFGFADQKRSTGCVPSRQTRGDPADRWSGASSHYLLEVAHILETCRDLMAWPVETARSGPSDYHRPPAERERVANKGMMCVSLFIRRTRRTPHHRQGA